jgi:hypothetical protein
MRGSRPGERRGGRQRGAKNKRTQALEHAQAEAALKIAGALGPEAFDGDAHSLLMAVYKDTTQPMEFRLAAAKAAIGFEKPRLAAVETKIEGNLEFSRLSDDELEELIRADLERFPGAMRPRARGAGARPKKASALPPRDGEMKALVTGASRADCAIVKRPFR